MGLARLSLLAFLIGQSIVRVGGVLGRNQYTSTPWISPGLQPGLYAGWLCFGRFTAVEMTAVSTDSKSSPRVAGPGFSLEALTRNAIMRQPSLRAIWLYHRRRKRAADGRSKSLNSLALPIAPVGSRSMATLRFPVHDPAAADLDEKEPAWRRSTPSNVMMWRLLLSS